MIDPTVKAGIRLPERAKELQTANNGLSLELALIYSLIEEIERVNEILRKHNFQ